MRCFYSILFLALFFTFLSGSLAYADNEDGEILPRPICFETTNTAPFPIRGSFVSNVYPDPSGVKARHRVNFLLKPDEKKVLCSNGPFYEGRRLEMVLRMSVPVFSCKTALYGPIMIRGAIDADKKHDVWAECL
jgi:hypothetical protein